MMSVTSGHILCEFTQMTPAYAFEVMCCFGDGVRKLSDPSLLKERGQFRVCCVCESETSLALRTSSGDQTTSDPVDKSAHVGVNAWLVLLAAAVSPAHHADSVVGAVTLAHKRAARVPLRRQTRFFTSFISLHNHPSEKKKTWNPLFAQTWQESTPPFMLPAQNMLSSSASPYTWGALHFSWEMRRTRASSSWLEPYLSGTDRGTETPQSSTASSSR